MTTKKNETQRAIHTATSREKKSLFSGVVVVVVVLLTLARVINIAARYWDAAAAAAARALIKDTVGSSLALWGPRGALPSATLCQKMRICCCSDPASITPSPLPGHPLAAAAVAAREGVGSRRRHHREEKTGGAAAALFTFLLLTTAAESSGAQSSKQQSILFGGVEASATAGSNWYLSAAPSLLENTGW